MHRRVSGPRGGRHWLAVLFCVWTFILCVSLSEVSRRIAYPVEPFSFECVQGEPPPPLLQSGRDGTGNPPSLSEKVCGSLANEL
ncbi:exported hypothetical protein [Verrucomicrobia bacterium]|nr:exported hypothetical protein [Verrucomicrobiota bacterium]